MRVSARSEVVWAVVCIGASVAGCAGCEYLPPGRVTHVKVPAIHRAASSREVASVLLENLAAFSAEGAEAELPAALEALSWSGRREDRLWVALLTLRARADEARDARALALLKVNTEDASKEGTDLAALELLARKQLASRIDAERTIQRSDRRLAEALEQVEHLDARLKKSQKKAEVLTARLRDERKKTEALAARLSRQEKKTTELQGQINQLKSIERIIDTHTQPEKTEAQK